MCIEKSSVEDTTLSTAVKKSHFSNNKSSATNDSCTPPPSKHKYIHIHTQSTCTVAGLLWCVSAVYPTNKSGSQCCLSEFLLSASAVHSQLAQLSPLSLAKQPICKDRGREKEKKSEKKNSREKPVDVTEKKRERETDCFNNADCQELHSCSGCCMCS